MAKKWATTHVPMAPRSFAQKYIACPRCEASAGNPCRTPSGNRVREGIHMDRVEIVLALVDYYRKTGARFATQRMASTIHEIQEEN